MKLAKLAVVLSMGMAASQAFAKADDIKLGLPAYGGTGCPGGSASATLSPDKKELSILFDSYVMEAGGPTGKTIDRKGCDVAIPVHVPQGLQISLIGVDYRGFNSLPQGARSVFNVEYFWAGQRGPQYAKTFTGPQDADYYIKNQLLVGSIVWSPCGQDVTLRTNSSMYAQTNSRREDTLATVDSADITAGIIYQMQWRSCH